MERARAPGKSPWQRRGAAVVRCQVCDEGLGVVSDGVLIVGVAVAIVQATRLQCMICGHHQLWRPAETRPDDRDGTIRVVG